MLIRELITRLDNEIEYKIDQSTLRYYDSVGLIKPDRLVNNYRDYSEKDYNKVKITVFMKQLNYSLYTIDQVINKINQNLINDILTKISEREQRYGTGFLCLGLFS